MYFAAIGEVGVAEEEGGVAVGLEGRVRHCICVEVRVVLDSNLRMNAIILYVYECTA